MLDMRIITDLSYVVSHLEDTNRSEENGMGKSTQQRPLCVRELWLNENAAWLWDSSLLNSFLQVWNFQCIHQKLEKMGKNIGLCCISKRNCNLLKIVSIDSSGCHYQEQSWANIFSHACSPFLPQCFISISVVRGMVALCTQEESFFSFRSNQPASFAPTFHAMAGIQTNYLAPLNLLPLLRNFIISFSLSMPRSSEF